MVKFTVTNRSYEDRQETDSDRYLLSRCQKADFNSVEFCLKIDILNQQNQAQIVYTACSRRIILSFYDLELFNVLDFLPKAAKWKQTTYKSKPHRVIN